MWEVSTNRSSDLSELKTEAPKGMQCKIFIWQEKNYKSKYICEEFDGVKKNMNFCKTYCTFIVSLLDLLYVILNNLYLEVFFMEIEK